MNSTTKAPPGQVREGLNGVHTGNGNPNGRSDPYDANRLFLADTDADIEAMALAFPGANRVLFSDVLDLDVSRLEELASDHDVVIVASEASRYARARALAVLEKVKPIASEVLAVTYPGPRLAFHPQLDTHGKALLWLRCLSELDATDLDQADDYVTATDAELGIVDASEIQEENPEWLEEDRFLRGKINLIAGEGGDGKTTIAIAVGAGVTRGISALTGKPIPVGRVAILAAEDGAGDTIKPRFVAAGADVTHGRLKILEARVKIPKKGNKPALVHPVNLQDIPYWRAVFSRLRLDVLIIDPLPAYLGRGVNDHKNADVQALLNQFAALASEFRVCVIAITHTGKAKDLKMVHRVLGSVAYTNCARVVHVTVRDPDDENARYLARPKCNLDEPRDPLAYKLVSAEYQAHGKTFRTARVEFEPEPVKIDCEAMVSGAKVARGPGPKKTMAVAEWLHDFLTNRPGPTPLGAIFDEAGAAGLVGKKRDDGKWSSGALLYQAKDRVPALSEPRHGKRVDNLDAAITSSGRQVKHWYLVATDAPY